MLGDKITIGQTPPPKKIVVFDLDETLGSFVELNMFWNALENYYGKKLSSEEFNNLLDIFPEFLRPNILTILKYLIEKKEKKECDQVMIYTNNQGPKSWVYLISNYFNTTIKYPLIDQIIAAFKVGGKIVEFNRTSHHKSIEDLIRCTKIKTNTEICFIDDQHHPLMNNENVYYMHVLPYTFSMPYEEMAAVYYENHNLYLRDQGIKKEFFIQKITDFMNKYNFKVNIKSESEKEVELVLSKQIMIHLYNFFKKKKTHTTKKRTTMNKLNSTKKKYI
jgi:hypothetical protein